MKIHNTTLAILLLSLTLVSCGNGKSTAAAESTSAAEPTSEADSTLAKLAAPTLTATLSGSVASLSWNAVSTASYYDIYRHQQNQSSTATKIASPLVSAGISYTQAIGAGTFYYWLKACNSSGCSDFSSVISLIKKAALNDTGISWGGDDAYGKNNSSCTSNINAPQDCNQGRDTQAAAGTLEKIGGGSAGFDFTKFDASGNALTASATSWSCVRDNATGLVWEVKVATGSANSITAIQGGTNNNIHHKDNLYRWGGITAIGSDYTDDASTTKGTYYTDWNTLVNGSNSAPLCGYSDWRVPTREELRSIVDYKRTNPSIDASYFLNTHSSSFWSASPYTDNSGDTWIIDFKHGYDSHSHNRSIASRLRLVRGGQSVHDASFTSATPVGSQVVKAYIVNQWQDSRYTDNSDDTVTDIKTGLMWKRCPEGQSGASCANDRSTQEFNWQKALEHADSHSFADHNDWRVPNIKELTSLVALDRYNPAINSTVFPHTPSSIFWSASPNATITISTWSVSFNNGYDYGGGRSNPERLRLVRGGE